MDAARKLLGGGGAAAGGGFLNGWMATGADSDECPVSGGQTSEVDLLTGKMLRQLMVDFVL